MPDEDDAILGEAISNTETEIFENALAEKPEPEPEPVKDEPEEQSRDEKGQFAAKEDEAKPSEVKPEAEKAKETDDDKGGQVPSWRVREINEEKRLLAEKLAASENERQAFRQQIEAFQRQQKPAEQPKKDIPDPLIDPDGYRAHIRAEMQEGLLNERRELSLSMAHRTYKKDFEEAYASAREAMSKGDVALAAKMQQSRDPGETLMEWHRQQKTMREVGDDPNAFFEKRLEEFLKDPANLGKVMERAKAAAATPQNGSRPNVQLPPSLSSLTRADNSHEGTDDNDLSDAALFNNAIR